MTDLGSGMNYRKKGLRLLLEDIVEDRVGRLVITHKDANTMPSSLNIRDIGEERKGALEAEAKATGASVLGRA